MNKSLVIGISILSMLGTTSAFAQSNYQNKHNNATAYHQNYKKPAPPRYTAQQKHRWTKGQRLPARYRGQVVRDYRHYRLAPPPRGYNWVRVDNDYVLIAAATGLISSILAGR